MRGFLKSLLVISMTLALPASAQIPESLRGPYVYGLVVSGFVTVFRAQMPGLAVGTPGDMLDAEVIFVLDSAPDMVFGVRYYDENPAAGAMVDTLRAAHLNGLPVTIQHVRAPGKRHVMVNWVQLGGLDILP